MKKVRVNVLLMDENNVIDCSFKGTQFTGVMDEKFIYAKCTYGDAPEYVQIPIESTYEATDEYVQLSGYSTKEIRISEDIVGVESLKEYSNPNLTEKLKKAIDESVKTEAECY